MINVIINKINIGIAANDRTLLLLFIELQPNKNLPEDKAVLGAVLSQLFTGTVIATILDTLEIATLENAAGVPAVLEYNDKDWVLYNFVDNSKRVSVSEISNILLEKFTITEKTDDLQ